ncbi:hypothetical protein B0T17DRAFT_619218 [Bombardia bombarda]|uniref:Uncharacterized protein n=1 Tax=Bombardia bombarda TaxID=252184 RepID=A0AA39WHM7_9PEZI|nr:hypothetical protein B0T17DRAFT_619218 [Bombardia bombarda]
MSRQPSETRTLTTFPTEGLPSPQITPNPRTHPVRYESGNSAPIAIQLNRWFCCRCAEKKYRDPVGMVNNDGLGAQYTECWRDSCKHAKCHNCALSQNHEQASVIRTVGGLHASPCFVDPRYWECHCGEWQGNVFDARCVLALTPCTNPSCAFKWRGELGVLLGSTIVMNVYGQRLGSADQSLAVTDGPWHLQRRALGDARCVLLEEFRDSEVWGSEARASVAEKARVWGEGEPAPRYPYRASPPSLAGQDGGCPEYKLEYLVGIPLVPGGGDYGSSVTEGGSARNSSSSRPYFSSWEGGQM